MRRLTRNSFKRKIIVFGAMIFASVALVSTGFAAFVLATQTTETNTGNVIVGEVVDKSFEITFETVTDQYDTALTEGNYKFAFDPTKGDKSGRVSGDGTNFENLSLTITGKVSNYDYLGTFTVSMAVPEAIRTAAAQNYITLPDCVGTVVNLKEVEGALVKDEATGSATFTYTISFGWGEIFGGMNPATYYDEDATGKTIEDATVKTNLNNFYTAANTTEPYTITFTATAK